MRAVVTFAAVHRHFTLKPRLCRYPAGWSLWWLWFEVARFKRKSGGDA